MRLIPCPRGQDRHDRERHHGREDADRLEPDPCADAGGQYEQQRAQDCRAKRTRANEDESADEDGAAARALEPLD